VIELDQRRQDQIVSNPRLDPLIKKSLRDVARSSLINHLVNDEESCLLYLPMAPASVASRRASCSFGFQPGGGRSMPCDAHRIPPSIQR